MIVATTARARGVFRIACCVGRERATLTHYKTMIQATAIRDDETNSLSSMNRAALTVELIIIHSESNRPVMACGAEQRVSRFRLCGLNAIGDEYR
tara:strand:- start:167382 stop:167666 length:285 start_codon:yes stop_codon:yes gene_type:complete